MKVNIEAMKKSCLLFFFRRYGGTEVELIITLSEIAQGLFLIFIPNSGWNTAAYQDFVYYGISPYLIAIPWLLSGFSSLVGLILFFLKESSESWFGIKTPKWSELCAPIRAYGSLISAILWAWVGLKVGLVIEWSIVYIVICFLFSLWSIFQMLRSLARWGDGGFWQIQQL